MFRGWHGRCDCWQVTMATVTMYRYVYKMFRISQTCCKHERLCECLICVCDRVWWRIVCVYQQSLLWSSSRFTYFHHWTTPTDLNPKQTLSPAVHALMTQYFTCGPKNAPLFSFPYLSDISDTVIKVANKDQDSYTIWVMLYLSFFSLSCNSMRPPPVCPSCEWAPS